VSNGKSLPKVLIAALHTAFFRPSLLDAKLVSIPSYTPTVVLPTQMELGRPHHDPNHGGNDAEPLQSDNAH